MRVSENYIEDPTRCVVSDDYGACPDDENGASALQDGNLDAMPALRQSKHDPECERRRDGQE